MRGDGKSLKDQITLLDLSLQMMKKARLLKVRIYDDLLDAYLLGEPEKLDTALKADSWKGIMSDEGLKETMLKIMLDNRNSGMAKSIIKALSSPDAGSCFFRCWYWPLYRCK